MASIRILIVDDVASMRAFVKASIRSSFQKNIELDEAGSGDAAMTALRSKRYDLVLCDWHMPGMTGGQLLEWMKGEEKLKEILFIMMTAHSSKDVVAEAIRAGVNDFIAKPITVDILCKKLAAHLRKIEAKKTDTAEVEDEA